ncbi:MAG: RNA polymerase sigma factor [Victivallaceae bacterium]|nr:RNA polymerase sigma factor [Victivallaceae bacterium]
MANGNDLKTIIDDNQTALLRYAGRILQDDILAQDAVQIAFIKYVKNNNEKIRNPRAWLFKVLRNHCFNILKTQKRKIEITLDEINIYSAGNPGPPDKSLMEDETAKLIRRSINALKPRHRDVVVLKLDHDKSYKEIAEILDLTVSNVGFILHAAMNELKNNLRETLSR